MNFCDTEERKCWGTKAVGKKVVEKGKDRETR